ncbi:MAG: family 20 glycosylhydrolase, partial [Spirochaeta sp.]|nr:family 20 glycosylhydrolase [Spirochaeta sp.]
DVARHFFPVETLERITDIIWLLRLNRFHIHLTDDQGWRFPVSEFPALTDTGGYRHDGTTENGRYGGSYTAGELQRIDREAALLGITVVPEIDLPGHASAALTAYPDLSCDQRAPGVQTEWGIFSHVLCTTRSETKRFLRAVFTAVRDTFGGSYIHIGGDEVPDGAWAACPACSRRDDPYQDIVREMAKLVLELGRRPVAWDEASRLDLPRSTIIVNWRRPGDAAAALERGYDLVLAPERRATYLDHKHRDTALEPGRLGVCTVADSAAFAPQAYVADHVSAGKSAKPGAPPNDAPASQTSRILGGQANLWTEELLYHAHIEYMGIVRLAAVADGLWSGEPARVNDAFFPDLDRLRRRLSERGYAVYTGPFSDEQA